MVFDEDAVHWASSVRHDQPHEPADAERIVLERADYIVDRARRFERIWPIHRSGSVASTAFTALSVIAPVAGFTSFLGPGTAGRHPADYSFAASTQDNVATVAFLVTLICQVLTLAGWYQLGRRTTGQDPVVPLVGMVFSIGTSLMILTKDSGLAWRPSSIVVMLSVAASLMGLVLMLLFRSKDPLPRVVLDRLSPAEREALLTERHKTLERLADRKLIKVTQVNKAQRRSLGALVGHELP